MSKDILTVAASGDHIINSFYKGAKKVYAFDINYLALLYTELKLVALQNLEYEEFLEFFMINDKRDKVKNKKALNYEIYQKRLKNSLSLNTSIYWDKLYKEFDNNGYQLRNSYIFNNKYDNNNIKQKSNLYLKSKNEYNVAKENIQNKEITLVHASYQNINLQNLNECDIIFMSNISDYIEKIYSKKSNYFEEYIKEIVKLFKSDKNKIVCAYLYNIQNDKYRSQIDNPLIRNTIFSKLNISYTEEQFESVIENCIDSVIII